MDSVLHLTDKEVKLGSSNRPFPHSTSVCLNHSTRARVGWTFSYICCIFVHPDLDSVHCFLKYGKRAFTEVQFCNYKTWNLGRSEDGFWVSMYITRVNVTPSERSSAKKPLFPGKGVAVLPYKGYIRYVHPQRVGFSAVFVSNGASSVAILFINRVWFLQSSVERNMFFWRSAFLFRS